MVCQRIAITPGEPAGIGPDLLIQLVQQPQPHRLIAYCDPQMLVARAEQLKLPLQLRSLADIGTEECAPIASGELVVVPVLCASTPVAGVGNPQNSAYVLACLDAAIDACQSGSAAALVTGPINKHFINSGTDESRRAFTGHTEYLADRCNVERVVMMLAVEAPDAFARPLRVALHSIHIPLSAVPATITNSALRETILIVHEAMKSQYAINKPKILVCGLNPHAGESGDLGREELDVINPCMATLRSEGIDVSDALPADTVFTRAYIESSDVIVAMYHDQGLAPLKSHGFGAAVNITLGLPIVRTSVDHGTAFDLAGSGKADESSLRHAIASAANLAAKQGRA